MTKNYLPQPHLFLVQKDLVFLICRADRAGIISPDVQAVEDTLRAKMGAPPAKRTDPTEITPSVLPEGWIELKKSASGEETPVIAPDKAGLQKLMAAFPYVPGFDAALFWKGWARSFGVTRRPAARTPTS